MLVAVLVRLNSKVPQFSADIDRFPHDSQVQQPLQEVYNTLFDSYTKVLRNLNGRKFGRLDRFDSPNTGQFPKALQSATMISHKTSI